MNKIIILMLLMISQVSTVSASSVYVSPEERVYPPRILDMSMFRNMNSYGDDLVLVIMGQILTGLVDATLMSKIYNWSFGDSTVVTEKQIQLETDIKANKLSFKKVNLAKIGNEGEELVKAYKYVIEDVLDREIVANSLSEIDADFLNKILKNKHDAGPLRAYYQKVVIDLGRAEQIIDNTDIANLGSRYTDLTTANNNLSHFTSVDELRTKVQELTAEQTKLKADLLSELDTAKANAVAKKLKRGFLKRGAKNVLGIVGIAIPTADLMFRLKLLLLNSKNPGWFPLGLYIDRKLVNYENYKRRLEE